jgi:predicted metal-dependent HD superfamily phosphohydrolase
MNENIANDANTNENYHSNLKQVANIAKYLMPKLQFHNWKHSLQVYKAATRIGKAENVDEHKLYLVKTAALLHDVLFLPKDKYCEERSAKTSEYILQNLNYSEQDISEVKTLILATKVPQKPEGLLQQVLCDADLDNLGRPDFFSLGEKFREEFEIPNNLDWYKTNLAFIKGHTYFTKSAKMMRDESQSKNVQVLEEKIAKYFL